MLVICCYFYSLPVLAEVYKKVALISVSSQYDEEKIDSVAETLLESGYSVSKKYLNQVVSDFGYVNTDSARAENLTKALLDSEIDIIWFVKGGGGGINLLPYLHKEKERLLSAKPKILVGFSDVTAIHSFVNETLKWKSLHGVVASYNKNNKDKDDKTPRVNDLEPLPSVEQIMTKGVSYQNVLPLNALAKKGIAGELRGGNFTLVSSLFSTIYEPDLSGKVLLLEDIGTSFRQLDRSLHQLLFMKELNVSAIIFGQFYPVDPTDEQRLIYKSVIKQFAEDYNKPVYYYPYVGHGRKNHPLILGTNATINCTKESEYCSINQ
ncbi:LD-carboxypeptidase [Spartinivicinus poritis]|uniref:LD-carboxypeptidase n=1 Tax=Spartinivicinus poritis TaxID=2994640 RepID=A0ABT5UCF8_9GAMM|nr:LD-carboxypeptidase [Spartinivicinus sp. A2-2]MDE1463123.1 LD-carboxypeptidase [Spartinivicinus sp. A2-2]